MVYGRWLIEGAPRVLLFDIWSAGHYLNEWKADLWNVAGIPTLIMTWKPMMLFCWVIWLLGFR